MSSCSGRCECHAADWQALDRAAGIKHTNHRSPRGAPRAYPNEAGFKDLLRQHYYAEWDKAGRDPERLPSKTAVADRFGCNKKTLYRNLHRYQAAWPPKEEEEAIRWVQGTYRKLTPVRLWDILDIEVRPLRTNPLSCSA